MSHPVVFDALVGLVERPDVSHPIRPDLAELFSRDRAAYDRVRELGASIIIDETNIYIYIYIYKCVCVCGSNTS